MDHPLYTEKTECQDCYKCVRSCPAKAIKIRDSHSEIVKERCIVCGKCVRVCPSGAQKVRDDSGRVKQLLRGERDVYISLAPSFPAEFGDDWQDLLKRFKICGFKGVSETALGADIVSSQLAKSSSISSACPTVVEAVLRFFPDRIGDLSPLYSPLLVHASLLRQIYGEDIAVVFVGPCIAKKLEADRYPDILDVALTFQEASALLDDLMPERVDLEDVSEQRFVPSRSGLGRVYPFDGGMLESMQQRANSIASLSGVSLSGIDHVLQFLDEGVGVDSVFCELLSCDGGCINGSGSSNEGSLLKRKMAVAKFCSLEESETNSLPDISDLNLLREYREGVSFEELRHNFGEDEIKRAFEKLGKYCESDILDCGGCGYDSCREFASAWLAEMAEPQMCVTRMRRAAQNKINALIGTIPFGVAIVNSNYEIVDCNGVFINLFSSVSIEVDEMVLRRVRGAPLAKFVDITELLRQFFSNGTARKQTLYEGPHVLELTIFAVEEVKLAGILFQDITTPALKRDTIVKKAEEVIQKNLKSVQMIASLLGENAAETEIILNSLIETYGTEIGDIDEEGC